MIVHFLVRERNVENIIDMVRGVLIYEVDDVPSVIAGGRFKLSEDFVKFYSFPLWLFLWGNNSVFALNRDFSPYQGYLIKVTPQEVASILMLEVFKVEQINSRRNSDASLNIGK